MSEDMVGIQKYDAAELRHTETERLWQVILGAQLTRNAEHDLLNRPSPPALHVHSDENGGGIHRRCNQEDQVSPLRHDSFVHRLPFSEREGRRYEA